VVLFPPTSASRGLFRDHLSCCLFGSSVTAPLSFGGARENFSFSFLSRPRWSQCRSWCLCLLPFSVNIGMSEPFPHSSELTVDRPPVIIAPIGCEIFHHLSTPRRRRFFFFFISNVAKIQVPPQAKYQPVLYRCFPLFLLCPEATPLLRTFSSLEECPRPAFHFSTRRSSYSSAAPLLKNRFPSVSLNISHRSSFECETTHLMLRPSFRYPFLPAVIPRLLCEDF